MYRFPTTQKKPAKTRGLIAVIGLIFLLCTAPLTADEHQATGLDATPDRLQEAAPQAQPHGLITTRNAMPGDGSQTETLPRSVDLSEYLPPVDSQGAIGSCSGWATIYYSKTLQQNMVRGWGANAPERIFSPLYTYVQITNGENRGSSIVAHMAMAVEQGAATLATMPELRDIDARPSNAAREEAAHYRAIRYDNISVYDRENDRRYVPVDRVRTALAQGNSVVVGVDVYQNFYSYRGGVYNSTSGQLGGGHAMTAVGYDDDRRVLKVVNSWGPHWGDNGFWHVTYDIFEKISRWGGGILYVPAAEQQQQTITHANPVSLSASRGSFINRIELAWDPVDGSREYIVYRSNNQSGTLREVARTRSPEYTDDELPPEVQYIYAIKAVSTSGIASNFSPIAEGSTAAPEPLSPPGRANNFQYFYDGRNAVFSWDAVDHAERYIIYRWDWSREDWFQHAVGTDTIYVENNVRHDHNHLGDYYFVTAANSMGEGEASEYVTFFAGNRSGNRDLADHLRTARPAFQSASSNLVYSEEFRRTDYFDYEYTMRQFQEFYEAEQQAFREFQQQQQSDFEEWQRRQNESFNQRNRR